MPGFVPASGRPDTMPRAALTFASAQSRIGEEVAVSDWFTVDQDHIDRFAAATHDLDWMHIDPERARRESPFGTTIALGFQTLSMLSHFSHDAGLWPENAAYGLNYGLERVRFMAPVPAGSRIRGRFVLKGFDARADGGWRMTTECTVEIEGGDKPAMVAEWIGLFYPAKAAAE
jgi:acyl dehydratase